MKGYFLYLAKHFVKQSGEFCSLGSFRLAVSKLTLGCTNINLQILEIISLRILYTTSTKEQKDKS